MSTETALASKTWHVRIDIGEHGGQTHAIARLDTGSGTELLGRGEAQVSPTDPDVPEIGDEFAVARALSQLAHTLLDTAAGDLSHVVRARVELDG